MSQLCPREKQKSEKNANAIAITSNAYKGRRAQPLQSLKGNGYKTVDAIR